MKFSTLVFLLYSVYLIGQNSKQFNLKAIDQLNEDVVDIEIYNPGKESIYILRTEQNTPVKTSLYSKQILPRSSTIVRIKLNPKEKGRLSEVVQLYLSHQDEPLSIKLNSKVLKVPKNNRQDCPRFDGRFQLNPSTGVYERQDAGEFQKFRVTLNLTEKLANQEHEIDSSSTSKKDEVVDRVEKQLETNEPITNDRRSQPSLGEILFGKKEDASLSLKDSTQSDAEIIADQTLLNQNYKPNNIIFLLDASTSMRKEEKMDLLKQAMIELLNPLRSIDYLAIVTYSGEAKVLLAPTSAINKNEIETQINNIKADGSTQAVKGIKRAIKVAKSNFLENGNNQIILVSDGAFDIGERNKSLRTQIKKEAGNGLIITTVGIKNEQWTNKSLKEISDLGKGHFIRIKNKGDVKKLLEEVKGQSKSN